MGVFGKPAPGIMGGKPPGGMAPGPGAGPGYPGGGAWGAGALPAGPMGGTIPGSGGAWADAALAQPRAISGNPNHHFPIVASLDNPPVPGLRRTRRAPLDTGAPPI